VQAKLNQKDEAKKNYLLAAKLKPDNATPWAALAQMALDENKLDLAVQHIARARTLQPANTTFRLIESRSLKRQGKAEEALQLLVNLDPAQKRLPGVMPQIAECYGLLDRPRDAANLYAAASDEEPTNGPYAFEAALWFERALDKVNGLKYAQRAAILKAEGAEKVVERLSK
jgi:predicted Zn-dependent protease